MAGRERTDLSADLYRQLLEQGARLESLMEQLLERDRRRGSTTSLLNAASPLPDGQPARLTERESQIARLLVAGQTNRQIGVQLQLGTGTVRNYLRRIFRKLGATTRTQAAVRALELGLTTRGSGSTGGSATDSDAPQDSRFSSSYAAPSVWAQRTSGRH